jgi:hypothetical protein
VYGLVNTAVRDLIISAHGQETWERVRSKAGVTSSSFVSMDRYDDSVTYDLVGAASEVLDTPADELLTAFGQYWTRFTAEKGYGEMLDFAGADFATFLSNLDDMHARVAMSFPELDPPSFELEQAQDGRLLLHYYSDRPALAPMVEGLLQGLAERFDETIDIEHVAPLDDDDHDRFLIAVHTKPDQQATADVPAGSGARMHAD